MTPAARRRAYAEFLLWGESVCGLAPETMRVYQLWLDKAHAALAADGVDLRHATRRHLLGYYQTARPTAATRTLIRKALRCYYDWLIDLEQRDDNPADRLPVMRARRGVPKPLTPAEVGRLEAAARDAGPRWVVAVALMLYTGLRAGEVVALRWEDVEGDWLRVTGKGGHTRTLPVHPRLAEALAAWGEECPSDVWVLPAGHRPGHLNNQVLRNKVRALGDAAGVEGLHPHRCRHTYGTWVMNATGDLALTQDALGHASPATTRIYAQVAPTRLAAAVTALDYSVVASLMGADNPLAGLRREDRDRLWDELCYLQETFHEEGRCQIERWMFYQQCALVDQVKAEAALLERLDVELDSVHEE